MSTVIKVENVSKLYRLGTVGTGSLAHDLNRWWHTLRGREDPYLKIGEENNRAVKGTSDVVWALRDISFEVKQGEVLGIIGRNGAGKSTLLKILSRTTAPTTGSVKVKGRMASLLEVGTGFHPELTGRENIFLNGAILGMRKAEIRTKFDEIVDFSGVERYIDTPVKRYSSGMYVRLAFAVAAHLEPEILIVDEVLAVGDLEFQKKALGKMKMVSTGQGRTVLFVSHNMSSMRSLCNTGILMSNGIVCGTGEIGYVVEKYVHSQSASTNSVSINYEKMDKGKTIFEVLHASILNAQFVPTRVFRTNEVIQIYLRYQVTQLIKGGLINFSVESNDNCIFLSFDTDLNVERLHERQPGIYESYITIPPTRLKPGIYTVSFNTGIANFIAYERIERCLTFEIILGDENETFISYAEKRNGIVAMPLEWRTKRLD